MMLESFIIIPTVRLKPLLDKIRLQTKTYRLIDISQDTRDFVKEIAQCRFILSSAMHALATKYAGHFNSRTGHVGSVFDGRFKSVPIESDVQLIAAVRYIHDNPRKAGICPAADYPWSSFGEYVGVKGSWGLTEVEPVLDMLGGPDGFLAMTSELRPNEYCFRSGKRIPEEDAHEIARAALYPLDPRTLRETFGVERGRALLALKDAGLSLRQIERVTGIGRYAVQKGILLAREE